MDTGCRPCPFATVAAGLRNALNDESLRASIFGFAAPVVVASVATDMKPVSSPEIEPCVSRIRQRRPRMTDGGRVKKTLLRAGLFDGVDADVVATLAGRMDPVTFARRRIVFSEGDIGDQLYIIIDGRVKVGHTIRNREALVAILGPADMFGELAVFEPGPRTSTVTTVTAVTALTMTRSALWDCIAEHPEIAEQLLTALARRLRRATDALYSQALTDAVGRVARTVLDLTSRFGEHDCGTWRISHGLSQAEIAQLAGVTRETTNKALVMFVDRGWIRLQGTVIDIRDPAALAERAK